MSNKAKPKNHAEAQASSDAKLDVDKKIAKAEKDQLLTEALEESFPASDPVSSNRFTPSKP